MPYVVAIAFGVLLGVWAYLAELVDKKTGGKGILRRGGL